MGRRIRLTGLLAICGAVALSGPAQGKSMSWTGAELVDSPHISFPTTTPTIDGDSIVFGTEAVDWAKLLTYRITPSAPNIMVSVTMNLTRLSGDWDPHFVLGDGERLIGVALVENAPGAAAINYADWGDRGYREFFLPEILTGSTFPAIGEDFEATFVFSLTDEQTSIYVTFFGNAAMWVGPALYRAMGNDLTFSMMRDNESGEQYKVNSMKVMVVTCQNPGLARCAPASLPGASQNAGRN